MPNMHFSMEDSTSAPGPVNLFEPLCLGHQNNLSFHWADFHETCVAYKNHIEIDSLSKQEFEKRVTSLKKLLLVPVWMKTANKIIQTTMYDLYDRYLMGSFKVFDQFEPFDRVELSFMSGTGPFKSMAVAECFNRATYQDFVVFGLMNDKLRKREFRLRCKTKLLFEYGANFEKAALMNLEQISCHGFLFSTESAEFMAQMSLTPHFRFLMDTKIMKESKGKTLEEIISLTKLQPFNLFYSSCKTDCFSADSQGINFQSGIDFMQSKKHHFFIPFDKINGGDLKSVKSFMEQTKTLISNLYETGSVLKSA